MKIYFYRVAKWCALFPMIGAVVIVLIWWMCRSFWAIEIFDMVDAALMGLMLTWIVLAIGLLFLVAFKMRVTRSTWRQFFSIVAMMAANPFAFFLLALHVSYISEEAYICVRNESAMDITHVRIISEYETQTIDQVASQDFATLSMNAGKGAAFYHDFAEPLPVVVQFEVNGRKVETKIPNVLNGNCYRFFILPDLRVLNGEQFFSTQE